MLGIIGKKIGMSQIFDEEGVVYPVTIIKAGPCMITQVKTNETDKYSAVQMGFEKQLEKRVNKPSLGHFKKSNLEPYHHLIEFRDFEKEFCQVGKEIKVDVFQAGNVVKVTGTSKGKGFQGVVKRHGFAGGPKTHGQSDRYRAGGSIGASAYPSRVVKGVKMAGRTGGSQETVRNLIIVKVDPENDMLYVKGAVPGAKNSIVTLRRLEK